MSRVFIQADELTLICRKCGEEEAIPSELLGKPFEWVVFIEAREGLHKNCKRVVRRPWPPVPPMDWVPLTAK